MMNYRACRYPKSFGSGQGYDLGPGNRFIPRRLVRTNQSVGTSAKASKVFR